MIRRRLVWLMAGNWSARNWSRRNPAFSQTNEKVVVVAERESTVIDCEYTIQRDR
jgi:hypothetical protein